MMGAALPAGTCAARLMLFVGGPSTEGAGKVVDKELSEPIRSHEARAQPYPDCYRGGILLSCWGQGVTVIPCVLCSVHVLTQAELCSFLG